MSQVAMNGAKPPKIVTAVLKLSETPIALTSTGNCSPSTDASTPLYPALRSCSQAQAMMQAVSVGQADIRKKAGQDVKKNSQAVITMIRGRNAILSDQWPKIGQKTASTRPPTRVAVKPV